MKQFFYLLVFLLLNNAILFAQQNKPKNEFPAKETPEEIKLEPKPVLKEANYALSLSAYGAFPYGHKIVAKEKLVLFGANFRFDYTLPKILAGKLSLLAQADLSRFSARTIPAWGGGFQAGAGFLFWQKAKNSIDGYASGGMVLGKVEGKEDFRLGLAELGVRYGYGISPHFRLLAGLGQKFFFDPVGFFTATALQFGGTYVF